MDGDFTFKFPIPNKIIDLPAPESEEDTESMKAVCMLGVASGISAQFRAQDTGKLGRRVVCCDSRSYAFNP